MNDVGVNSVPDQPPRQPEPVAAGFVRNGNPRDGATFLDRLVAPAVQEPQQRRLVRNDLLARLTLDPRHGSGNEPARLAHLDDGNEGGVLLKGDQGAARVVRRGAYGPPSALMTSAMVHPSRRPPQASLLAGTLTRWNGS